MYDNMIENVDILIMTATDLETRELNKILKPLFEGKEVETIYEGSQTYFVGRIGRYAVAHVQTTSMGSVSRGGSLITTNDAIQFWKPKAIIMVGIAFGKSKEKQNIGDILISQSLVQYELCKIGKDEVIMRGSIPEAGQVLSNRFARIKEKWNFDLDEGKRAKVHFGRLLTGEKLIDRDEFKTDLLKHFKEAIGGEMEGGGIYSAASHNDINEWIVVKGICDWADGNKSENKKENQELAARSAFDLCKLVLNESRVFKHLKIDEVEELKWDGDSAAEESGESMKSSNKTIFNITNQINGDNYMPTSYGNGSINMTFNNKK